MSTETRKIDLATIEYPDSDGEPMSDNTEQFEWITLIKSELEAIFKDDENVFIAGDLLWYPVEGDPTIRRAPDAMVAIGRPKGYRGSYKQWEEAGIAPQVVFEIISPKNTPREMKEKLAFYDLYRVEEYYEYDPARKRLKGWQRTGTALTPIANVTNWVSPRLKIRFELAKGAELKLYRPDGQAFRSFVELDNALEQERERANLAEQQAEQAQQKLERLMAKLRAEGIEVDE